MDKPLQYIASDFQRGTMIQVAMRKAAELAMESFYHGWGGDALADADLLLFAEDAWERFSRTTSFDYPQYAHTLFLQAYRAAYHAYVDELPKGIHPNIQTLVETMETERGLRPSQQ